MRGSAIAASLALSVMALSAAPVFRTGRRPGQAKPRRPPAAGASRPPRRCRRPAPRPRMAPQPPAPFPQGAKVAFINPQRVFQESTDGKAAVARVNALIAKKQKENEDKAKLLAGQPAEAADERQRDERGRARRSSRRKSRSRRRTPSASSRTRRPRSTSCSRKCRTSSSRRCRPVIQAIANEEGLQIVFNAAEAGLAWVDPNLDLTLDVIKKLDAGAKPAAAK